MRLYDSNDLAALLRPRPRRQSSGEVRRQADLAALRLVARYGHCTVSDFAAALYPRGKYAVQSAQRLARRLVGHSPPLLAERLNALGGRSFVLSRSGVAFLELHGTICRHGMDLASVAGPTYRHHALTARFCQTQELLGLTAWTEHAIGQGLAALSQTEVLELCGKLPDALLHAPGPVPGESLDQGGSVEAVEVEQARKGNTSLVRCLRQAERASNGASVRGFKLRGVVFVFDRNQNHANRIARIARAIWTPPQRAQFSKHVRLVSVVKRPPLVFGEWDGNPLVI
jgi:hypothetical protein